MFYKLQDLNKTHRPRAGNFLKCILDGRTIVHFVQLHQEIFLQARFFQSRFSHRTIRTVDFWEYCNLVGLGYIVYKVYFWGRHFQRFCFRKIFRSPNKIGRARVLLEQRLNKGRKSTGTGPAQGENFLNHSLFKIAFRISTYCGNHMNLLIKYVFKITAKCALLQLILKNYPMKVGYICIIYTQSKLLNPLHFHSMHCALFLNEIVHLQGSSFLQHWLQFASVCKLLHIISPSNKLAPNEHSWNLQIEIIIIYCFH